MDSILFLCTANYYRSRFAEELFNHKAQANDCRADSRGLHKDLSAQKYVAPMSPLALFGLHERGIKPLNAIRQPITVKHADFEEATLIIAMSREEHYPLMKKQYPMFAEQIEYWDVADLGILSPNVALSKIDFLVEQLLKRV